jgi:DNA invertase Pin-like site-specific DNA recombinase
MIVIAYLRASTGRQVKDGFGLADQEKQIRAWCRKYRHKLLRVVTDEALSGTLPAAERPGLLECLRAVRDGEAEGIVMRDLDRIARELTTQEGILAQLWKLGGHAFITTDGNEVPQDDPDDPMRTAMRQMMGVFAQLERSMAIKRMKNGRQTKAEQGGFAYGSPAFGQSSQDKKLVKNDSEQVVIARIREMDAKGDSIRAICAALNAEGLPSKRGRKWHPQTVARVLNRDVAAVKQTD